jgi:hypothetical protein
MPITSMVCVAQEIEIDEITDVTVTALMHDDIRGDFYREIVFFGTPPEQLLQEGVTPVDVSATTPTVLRVRIRAATVDPLHVTVPASEF